MRLGVRDMLRAKLRFGLLGGALALLVFLLLFLNTLSSTLLGFFTGAVRHNDADLLVYNSSARRNLQASRLDPDLVKVVRGIPGVVAVGEIGNTTLTVDVGKGPADLNLWGFEPGQPGGPGNVVGRASPRAGEALVDEADRANGFTIGTVIRVQPTGVQLRVVGYTKDSRFNVGPTAYTTLATYRDVVRAANPKGRDTDNLFGVRLARNVSPAGVATAIHEGNPNFEALSRRQAVASLPGVSSITQSFNLVVGITFVIVVVVIGFFFLILTVQKLRVFALLRAVGATTGYLAAALAVQVVTMVIVGMAAATAMLGVAAVNSSPAFPLRVDPKLVGVATVAVLLFSLAASLSSVRRIASLDPAEAAGLG
jgi:putative ABC transport system permease protein